MQVSPSIFKAYDVRGVVPSTLDEQVAEALGKAFGTVSYTHLTLPTIYSV